MTININLTSRSLAKIDERKIILPENEVFIHFTSSLYSLGTLVVTVKNSEFKKQYKTTGEPIDISVLCTRAGTVEIEVSMVINCEPVKTWRIEPLILCEINHKFEAIPEIEQLKLEINNVKAAIKEVAYLVKENETI